MSKPAIKNNRILQSQQVLNAFIAIVRPSLPLELQNTRITKEDIIAVLGYASVYRISMDAACHELKEAPSANRLREVLAQALPDRATLQRALNRILRAQTLCVYNRETIAPNNLVSRAQEKRDDRRTRPADRSGSQSQASPAYNGIQIKYPPRIG